MLVADLLLGHAQRLVVPPVDPQKIEAADSQEKKRSLPQQVLERVANYRKRGPDAHASQTSIGRQVCPTDRVNGQGQKRKEQESLEKRGHILLRDVLDLL
jgi:hypothetical protein